MPDLEIIEKHLSSFISDLDNLKRHRSVTIEEIKANKDLLWILERGIYLLIHVTQSYKEAFILACPESADFKENWDFYTDIPDILAKHRIITEEDNILLK